MEASLKRGDSQYSLLAQLYIAQQKLFDTHEQHEDHWELAFKIQFVMTGSQPSIEVQESIIEGHRGREYPDATQVLSEFPDYSIDSSSLSPQSLATHSIQNESNRQVKF